MLSDEEKKEMLEDAKSISRRDDFRRARRDNDPPSFDDYLIFLNDLQKIFGLFSVSKKITRTKLNKL